MPAQRNVELAEAVAAMGRERFAVLDAAQFTDLPQLLDHVGLDYRPLYLQRQHGPATLAGPYLIRLQNDIKVEHLLALMGDGPTGSFWACPDGMKPLYRHLRSVTVVRLPRGAIETTDVRPNFETSVLFRFFDPRVLLVVLPHFSKEQMSRLFGPLTEIVFADPENGEVHRIERNDGWPLPAPGMLQVGRVQADAMSAERLHRSQEKIAGFLRDVAPDYLRDTHPDELMRFVRDCDTSARSLGISSERGIGQWSFLMLLTDGKILDLPGLKSTFYGAGLSSDELVSRILQGVASAAPPRDGTRP